MTASHSTPVPCASCARHVKLKCKGICGTCYARMWRNANPEKAKARDRAWYAKNREALRKYQTDRYHRDPERARAYAREIRARHIDKVRLRERQRPSHVKLWKNAKNRATAAGLPFNLSPADVQIPPACPICHCTISSNAGSVAANSPSVDKLIPSLGYVVGNVWVICHKCNSTKGDATPEFMLRVISEMVARGLLVGTAIYTVPKSKDTAA